MMDKKFNVKDFSEQYMKQINASAKETFIKTKLKVVDYLPYQEKIIIAKNIVKSTSYAIGRNEETGGLTKTNRIKINSPMRYILFVMTVVNKYTNIEVNFNDVMPEFDDLNKNGLIEVIFNKVGEREIGELKIIIDSVLEDFMTNEYEIKNYIADKLYKANELVQKIIPVVENITNKIESLSDDDIKKISEKIDKIGKFIRK